MSSFISFVFTLLLFFSMHGYCKARHLAVGNKGFASLFHYPHKGLFPGMVKVKLEIDSMGGKTKGISDSINADNAEVVAKSTENRKDHSRISIKEHNKYRNGGGGGGGGGFSGVVPINKPLVSSVSWRVPNKNHDNNHHNQHPGIFSDYSRPITRPPSHN